MKNSGYKYTSQSFSKALALEPEKEAQFDKLMFGLSIFRIYNLYCREVSMWNLLQNIMPTKKPDVKIFGKQFSGYNNLDFTFIIYRVTLNRLITPFSKT